MMIYEKRKYPRIDVCNIAELSAREGSIVPVQLLNLSEGGAALTLSAEDAKQMEFCGPGEAELRDADFHLSFSLLTDEGEALVHAPAQMIYAENRNDEEYFLGVMFMGGEFPGARALASHINKSVGFTA